MLNILQNKKKMKKIIQLKHKNRNQRSPEDSMLIRNEEAVSASAEKMVTELERALS